MSSIELDPRPPDWSKGVPHNVDIMIDGKKRNLNELEDKPTRTYGREKDIKPELLKLMKTHAYTVGEIAEHFSIRRGSAHTILQRLMRDGIVGRAFDPNTNKMFYSLMEHFPKGVQEEMKRRYE